MNHRVILRSIAAAAPPEDYSRLVNTCGCKVSASSHLVGRCEVLSPQIHLRFFRNAEFLFPLALSVRLDFPICISTRSNTKAALPTLVGLGLIGLFDSWGVISSRQGTLQHSMWCRHGKDLFLVGFGFGFRGLYGFPAVSAPNANTCVLERLNSYVSRGLLPVACVPPRAEQSPAFALSVRYPLT